MNTPTETGPWETWQEVPEGVIVRAANGERFRKNGVAAIHLLTNGDGDCCQYTPDEYFLPTPFFSAEEPS
ncbi:MAG: hypothetical protein U5O16_23505 [Rhodococcus sp. (in: high G+C Gram-positive bacteria)]|uniref:hypothetical protein n=1 Tax=Rhodococcus sp. TaxID=1831 RepID=UPI002AD77FD6|nr:hypothetical protein [Rhodococcus sp. (in: high G+C Gram-positive bacteria)]